MRLNATDEQIEMVCRFMRAKKSNRDILKRFNHGEKRAVLALEYGISEEAVKQLVWRFRRRRNELLSYAKIEQQRVGTLKGLKFGD